VSRTNESSYYPLPWGRRQPGCLTANGRSTGSKPCRSPGAETLRGTVLGLTIRPPPLHIRLSKNKLSKRVQRPREKLAGVARLPNARTSGYFRPNYRLRVRGSEGKGVYLRRGWLRLLRRMPMLRISFASHSVNNSLHSGRGGRDGPRCHCGRDVRRGCEVDAEHRSDPSRNRSSPRSLVLSDHEFSWQVNRKLW